MHQFTWEITEVLSENEVLKSVKYQVTAKDGEKEVKTEGYCFLTLPPEVIFKDLLESELIEYLKRFYIQSDVNTIESRLNEQLEYLNQQTSNIPPWHIETFKVEV